VQPGQRALHDVQRPAAVPGREHDRRAQAGRGRHAPPDPGDHPGGPGVALRADLEAASQEPGRPDRFGTRRRGPARATTGGAPGARKRPRGNGCPEVGGGGGEGAGVANLHDPLTIDGYSTISDNYATYDGGGVFTTDGGTTALTDATVTGNSAG